jgi:dUTP pyrophosphatase
MNVRVMRIDDSMPLPEYQTPGSVALDLASREEIDIAPKSIALVPTGLIIEVPNGYVGLIAIRSSTPYKKGLMLANGIGVVDQDYCGPNDEWKVMLYNTTESPVHVSKYERIAQVMFVPVAKIQWFERKYSPALNSRGGIGSTG